MSYWVYVHTCKANGKKYVGVTTKRKPELRWAEGKGYYQNKHFYSAIKKYGWTNFQHEVFEVDSKEEMYYAEKYLIAYYHTTESEFGYNHSVGGEGGGLGCIRSEETRKRIAENNRRKAKDPEFRRKISEARKKEWLDPEYRRKQSEARKGLIRSEESRQKMSESHKGKPLSLEHRKHMSEAQKGKPKPRVKIQLPDGTVLEMTKNIIVRDYVNRGKKFEYVS